ncbi:hypothetical protein FB451DRAFT_1394568 [Mycena latifolia]|nr:hypothetical protein FB451DRAFT_1394568 [Mycena latifolia]
MDVDAAKAEDTALDDSWRTSWNATFDVLAESVRENPANVFSGGVDAEPAERAWWESEQWNNVRTFATRAMRTGERRDMLLDEAHEERLSMNPVSWRATDAMKDVYLYDWERMRLKERMATMVTGATEMTRARARIRRLDQRIREAVDRYRAASYEALLEARRPGLQRDWNGMEKRRRSVSPDPPRPRINPWVTPFTPPSDEGLRRARARSLPVGVEALKREEAAKREKLGSSPETVWSAAFKTTFVYLKEDTSVDAAHVLISPIRWRAADAWADAERYQWERNHLLQGLHKTASGVRTRAHARERIDRLGERILEALGLYREATYLARLEDFAQAPRLEQD